jgi:hypothetical protein
MSCITNVTYDIVMLPQLVPQDQIVALCQIVISFPIAYLCYSGLWINTQSTVKRVHYYLVPICHCFITSFLSFLSSPEEGCHKAVERTRLLLKQVAPYMPPEPPNLSIVKLL